MCPLINPRPTNDWGSVQRVWLKGAWLVFLGLSLGGIVSLVIGIVSGVYYLAFADDHDLWVTAQELLNELVVQLVIAVDRARDVIVSSLFFLFGRNWLIVVRPCVRPKNRRAKLATTEQGIDWDYG